MAFSYAILHRNVSGDRYIITGTFTNGATDTGGDIDTGLQVVENFQIQEVGSAVVVDKSVVNESFPCGGIVTIVTDADVDGIWRAEGY